jgi:hypothetical protein
MNPAAACTKPVRVPSPEGIRIDSRPYGRIGRCAPLPSAPRRQFADNASEEGRRLGLVPRSNMSWRRHASVPTHRCATACCRRLAPSTKRSRTIDEAANSLNPLNETWRSSPSFVRSKNSTCAANSGRTRCGCRRDRVSDVRGLEYRTRARGRVSQAVHLRASPKTRSQPALHIRRGAPVGWRRGCVALVLDPHRPSRHFCRAGNPGIQTFGESRRT